MRLIVPLLTILSLFGDRLVPGGPSSGQAHAQTSPYRALSGAGVGFLGDGRELREPASLEAVRVGVMFPEGKPEGLHLRYGVELAMEEANRHGGYRGLPYEAVVRSDDGPWGIAAKQVVRLAYEDSVWVILGTLDGHHTHLAELIAAKAWVPVVAPWTSDRSVDYANVPWVFRCMIDDGRQARCLVRHAKAREYDRIVVLTEGERESRRGWDRLRDAAREERCGFALHLEYDPRDPESIVPRVCNAGADALIVWGQPERLIPLLRRLRETGVTVPILGPALLLSLSLAESAIDLENILVASPFDLTIRRSELQAFDRRYREHAGMAPSPVALYAYDCMRMIQQAVERAGLNRARIRDELAGMSFGGLVGRIHFDGLGGNPAEPVLMALVGGKWTSVD